MCIRDRLRKLESEYQDKEREYNELFQNYCKILKENERLYVDNVQATKGIRHLRYSICNVSLDH